MRKRQQQRHNHHQQDNNHLSRSHNKITTPPHHAKDDASIAMENTLTRVAWKDVRLVLVGRHDQDDMGVLKALTRHGCSVRHVILPQTPKTIEERDGVIQSVKTFGQLISASTVMFVNMYPSTESVTHLRPHFKRILVYLGRQFMCDNPQWLYDMRYRVDAIIVHQRTLQHDALQTPTSLLSSSVIAIPAHIQHTPQTTEDSTITHDNNTAIQTSPSSPMRQLWIAPVIVIEHAPSSERSWNNWARSVYPYLDIKSPTFSATDKIGIPSLSVSNQETTALQSLRASPAIGDLLLFDNNPTHTATNDQTKIITAPSMIPRPPSFDLLKTTSLPHTTNILKPNVNKKNADNNTIIDTFDNSSLKSLSQAKNIISPPVPDRLVNHAMRAYYDPSETIPFLIMLRDYIHRSSSSATRTTLIEKSSISFASSAPPIPALKNALWNRLEKDTEIDS